MSRRLRLISHKLCPYVQRAAIIAAEKNIPFERVDIDLANKPGWFLELSPTGKVPLLEVRASDGGSTVLFESAVIAEYLDESAGDPLLPADPLERARQRAWVEFASAVLNDIARLYSAADEPGFVEVRQALEQRFARLDPEIAGPWFTGDRFGLVDAAFGPAFRYIDLFNAHAGTELVGCTLKVRKWAEALAARPSVAAAVPSDYGERLIDFVAARNGHLAALLTSAERRAA